VRKWFNIRSKAHDFHADDAAAAGRRGGGGDDDDEWRGSSFTRREPSTAKKSKTERPSRRSREHSRRGKIDLDAAEATVTMDYRFVRRRRLSASVSMLVGDSLIPHSCPSVILSPCLFLEKKYIRIFVATWNVGGRSPPSGMGLEDWLHAAPPADIYVLGYVDLPCLLGIHPFTHA
jgi:hypothetical protein